MFSKLIFLFCLFVANVFSNEISRTTFALTPEPIDVVIPCAPKDLATLEMCIAGIRQNGSNIRRVIVVSKNRLTDSAEWVDEQNFPFSFKEIALEIFNGNSIAADQFLQKSKSRIGWVFQQLLKLYAAFVIPDISSNILILDADVIFLNPTRFINEYGEPLFNTGTENWKPYFLHAKRLLPGLRRVHRHYSGICHFMLFQKPILQDFFEMIQAQHRVEAWKAICRCIDQRELKFCCMSEYEIYFNFALLRTSQAKLQPLKWVNLGHWKDMDYYKLENFCYMACQEWMRSLNKETITIYPAEGENAKN